MITATSIARPMAIFRVVNISPSKPENIYILFHDISKYISKRNKDILKVNIYVV